jgi:hypothetical protein
MEALSVVTPADEPGSSARKSLRAKGLSHRRRGAAGCRHKAGMTEKPNVPQKEPFVSSRSRRNDRRPFASEDLGLRL